MSAHNNKAFTSIFDSQDSNSLKERQRLEELQRQAKVQKVKLDKQLNKQKIIMGAFLGQVLATEGDDEQMIREYFAIHFPDFLTRESDKYLFKSMVESLGGDMGLGDEEDSFVARENQVAKQNAEVDKSESVSDMPVKMIKDFTAHDINEQVVAEESMSVENEQENFYTTHDDRQRDLLSDEENNFNQRHDY